MKTSYLGLSIPLYLTVCTLYGCGFMCSFSATSSKFSLCMALIGKCIRMLLGVIFLSCSFSRIIVSCFQNFNLIHTPLLTKLYIFIAEFIFYTLYLFWFFYFNQSDILSGSYSMHFMFLPAHSFILLQIFVTNQFQKPKKHVIGAVIERDHS